MWEAAVGGGHGHKARTFSIRMTQALGKGVNLPQISLRSLCKSGERGRHYNGKGLVGA